MSDVALFAYHGPTVRIVALDLEVSAGDQLYGPAILELNDGFERVAASDAKKTKVLNSRDDAVEAVEAVGGSGEQTEADR